MLQKTEGIVLNFIKYGDSSIITRIYTRKLGLQSYIVNGVRSAKGRQKIAFFQHLTILDLVVYFKENAGLNRISEMKCSEVFHDLPYNHHKTAIALFISDVLARCIHDHNPNTELYDFLKEAVLNLDKTNAKTENFPVYFVGKLIYHLGLLPENANELFEQVGYRAHQGILLSILDKLIQNSDYTTLEMANKDRRELMNILLKFLQLNFESIGKMQSLEILKEILE